MGILQSKFFRNPKLVSEYVQTDEAQPVKDVQGMSTPDFKLKNAFLDPRSITRGIDRTPLVLARHMDETPKKSFLETDIDAAEISDDLANLSIAKQVVVEDRSETVDFIVVDEEKIEEAEILCVKEESDLPSPIYQDSPPKDTLPVFQDFEDIPPIVEPSTPTEKKPVSNPEFTTPDIKRMKKKAFLTPNNLLKATPESIIKTRGGRTPLGAVCQNSPDNRNGGSPAVKAWRGLDEERRKLGLENTPPPHSTLPLSDQVQSAPGKMLIRKNRLDRARWDHDNTLVI